MSLSSVSDRSPDWLAQVQEPGRGCTEAALAAENIPDAVLVELVRSGLASGGGFRYLRWIMGRYFFALAFASAAVVGALKCLNRPSVWPASYVFELRLTFCEPGSPSAVSWGAVFTGAGVASGGSAIVCGMT